MTHILGRIRVGILTAFVVAMAVGAVPVSAASPTEIPLGTSPQRVAVSDLNSDGIPDLVVGVAGGIVVLLGRGDGTFGAEQSFAPNGGVGNALAIGDFNGDGKLDVATGGGLLLGNGDGTFHPFGPSFGVSGVNSAVATDLNGDGKLDVVLIAFGQTSVSLGNGDGTFRPGATYPYGSWHVRLADLNRDGKLDMVIPDAGGTVVLLGNGDGTFGAPVTHFTGGNDAVVGDLNGDGILDIVTVGGGCLTYALGRGDGTFAGGGSCVGEGSPLALGDFNADGHLDIFAGGTGVASQWLAGNGDGTFGSPTAVSVGAANSSHDVVIDDLNRDGYQDIVLTNQQNNSVSVLLGPLAPPAPGSAAVSPAGIAFGPLPAWQTGPSQTVTLTSNGPGALIVSGWHVDPGYSVTSNCPINGRLAAGSSCNFNVSFAPTDGVQYRGALTILDSDPSGSQAVSLSGSGLTNPTSVTVDGVTATVGTPVNFRAVVNSNGQPPVVGGQVSFQLPNGATFASGFGKDGVAGYFGYDTTTFTPGFYPNGIRVDYPGVSGYGPSVGFADLTVNSRPVAKIVISPSPLDFGSVAGRSTAHGMVTITNTGNAVYHFTGATGTGDFSIPSGSCATALAPGSSCSLYVDFSPTQPGTRTGILSVTGDDPSSPDTTGLTGFGMMPVAKLSTASLVFQPQRAGTSSAVQSVIVSNSGNAALVIASVAIAGTNRADFRVTSNGCGSPVGAGASCKINVAFAPTYHGNRSATLQINDNAFEGIQAVALSGTGIASLLSTSPAAIDFGTVGVGQRSADLKLSLTNSGNANLQASSVTISGANQEDFWISGSQCPLTLAPGSSCAITIAFEPGAVGTRVATLKFVTNGAPTVVSVALSGIGR